MRSRLRHRRLEAGPLQAEGQLSAPALPSCPHAELALLQPGEQVIRLPRCKFGLLSANAHA